MFADQARWRKVECACEYCDTRVLSFVCFVSFVVTTKCFFSRQFPRC